MMSAPVSRRRVLHAIIMAPVVGCGLFRSALEAHDVLARRLTDVFSAKRSAAFVGERYLLQHPVEASVAQLVRLVAQGRGGPQRLYALDALSLRREIASFIHDDFVAGSTIRLDGWILSVTEVRLMALVALTSTTRGSATYI